MQGDFRIEGCPNKFCGDVAETIPLINFFYKGLPPVAGGVLDQTTKFVNAARYFQNEVDRND
jgi:hypothetical protein